MKSKIMMTYCVGLLLFFIIASAATHAEVPKQINYQGYLTDPDGNPVPDGQYDMLFKIWDEPTDGTELWTEDNTVTATKGIYNVILGTGVPIEPDNFDGDGDRYLGITVDPDIDEMMPRQKLTSTVYSLRAAKADSVADGAVSSAMIADGAVDGNKVADNAITSAKIANSSITSADINDGAGSGLNADQLDGLEASEFITEVNAGTGLSGGGTSGNVTLDVDIPFSLTGSVDGGLIISSNTDTSGYGVYGESSGGLGVGVYGKTSGSIGKGVYGIALGSSGFGVGVWGSSEGTTSAGVHGKATGSSGNGVYGEATGASGHGVYGKASNEGNFQNYGGWFEAKGSDGTGVYGLASAEGMDAENYGGYFVAHGDFGKGVYGESSGGFGVGVYGETSGSIGKGVYGIALGSSGFGVGVWGSAEGTTSAGVRGSATGSSGFGVYAEATGASGMGVYGEASNEGDFKNYGGYFIANGTSGVGIYADGGSDGYAAVFHGNVLIKSESTGASVVEFGEGLDYAEGFDISEEIKVARGSVLIIDADNPGRLKLSDSPYDTKVAGIVAGGKGMGSGVRLGAGQFDYDVALAGRVYCNVDTTYGEVTPGDLLTTSSTPGYAMVVKDQNKSQGAILGKAMESLPQDKKDQILVLVTLQ